MVYWAGFIPVFVNSVERYQTELEGGWVTVILIRGVMVARYKPWKLLTTLSSVKLYCLVFHIVVFKKNVSPFPTNIYLKSLWNGFHILHWICKGIR